MGKKTFCLIVIVFLVFFSSSCRKTPVADDIKEACVEIAVNDQIFASGFWVDGKGHILTAAHIFKDLYGRTDISIKSAYDGNTYEAELDKADFGKDLALLKCDVSAPVYLDLDCHYPLVCYSVYIVGNANGKGLKTLDAKIQKQSVNISTDTKRFTGHMPTGQMEMGCSGAPVVAKRGQFVGMAVGKNATNDEIYAVSAQEIKAFLEEYS
ncbi:MAG TPA: serine protease [Clostridia bacterium]|nr:serine protease [Clostridia bacterium]